MATKHQWNSMSRPGGANDGKFMKLKPDSKNKFRPVGDPVVFFRYYVPGPDGKIASAITDDPESCVVVQKHSLQPRQRAAVNVIDRQDGKHKILEGPYSIFADMKTMWEGEGESPGGQDGAEFGVKVDIPGGDRSKTKYKVMCYGKSAVTPEEKARIKENKLSNNKLYNLEEEFKATPQDEIEAKLGLVAATSKKSSSFDDDDSPKASSSAAKGGTAEDLDF